MLSSLDETIIQHDQSFNLALHRYKGVYEPRGHKYITDFEYTPTPTITYRVGGVILLGEKRDPKEIEDYMNNTTIEGLYTLKSIHKLINDRKVDIPIIDLIYDIIFNDVDPINLQSFLVNKK